MSFKRRLTGRCEIQKKQQGAADKWNTRTTTYVAPRDLVSVPCFFYPITGVENTSAQREISLERNVFDFQKGVPIEHDDRIKYEGQIYEIVRVVPVGGNHHLMVEARQIEL